MACPAPGVAGDREAAATDCLHCGTALGDAPAEPFCCSGCRLVYSLIHREHLDRYYDLRGERGQPLFNMSLLGGRDHKWLEPVVATLAAQQGVARVDLDIQGLHCVGCVWLLEEVFRKMSGGVSFLVNPALGKMHLNVQPGFPLAAYVDRVESFGYVLGPSVKKEEASAAGGLLFRMGACIAIAMNSMIFAIAVYAGLERGPLFHLFHTLNFVLSIVSVAVGGSVFFRSAWAGLRRGLLHLDTPIAFGILLAFSGSAWSYFERASGSAYFDTLNVFIALMLVGRWLQERVLEKNRRYLLESDGVEGLLARRIEGGAVAVVSCRELRAGDLLVIAPGDLVPVSSSLEEDRASFSLDWINGESRPRDYARGDVVPAGAFLASVRAMTVRATEEFAASPLVDLLRTPVKREADVARATGFWQSLARVWVVAVLVAAAGGFAFDWLRHHDLGHAIDVVTAVLIVTCPCAFGIASPMAYELVQNGLRKAGLFVRSPGFLDRATAVQRVVFDKTGTLTTGTPRVLDPSPIAALGADERHALYNLVARSTHPKSQSVRKLLEGTGLAFDPELTVEEHAGRGLSLEHGGRVYRFGAPGWVAPEVRADGDIAFGEGGRLLSALTTGEDIRPDASAEVARLREAGYDVWVLSGDAAPRVHALADACGIPQDHEVAECTADGKAAWIRAHDRQDTLMIGDGINDSLVVSEAFCSGTPAIDRPFMAARSDFYFVAAGLRPVRVALEAGHALARVVRRNLRTAIAYNVLAVGLAWAGLMSPLLCAVLMPVSSITTILSTIASLSGRNAPWKS